MRPLGLEVVDVDVQDAFEVAARTVLTSLYDPLMVPEAPLEPTDSGLVQAGEGWFVVNARAARWRYAEGRGGVCPFGDEPAFPQVGVNLFVLGPGEPMAMYHWEVDQEDFLMLAGAAILIVEGEERPLRQWDFVHCPAGTRHVIVGAGDGPSASVVSCSTPAPCRSAASSTA